MTRSDRSDRSLTTTAYAILGVLAIRARSAYELAAEMRHCFEYYWPRDDVRVYTDAKRLAKLGLVSARQRRNGKRRQTTYAITPKGRAALREWLRRPPAPVALDFEALIKVFLARFGTLDDLRRNVDHVRGDAEYMLQVATNVRQLYLLRCAPFQQEYAHVWAFVYDFLVSWFQMLHGWSTRTLEEMGGWRDLTPRRKEKRALERFGEKVPAAWLSPDVPSLRAQVPAVPGMWKRRHSVMRTPTR